MNQANSLAIQSKYQPSEESSSVIKMSEIESVTESIGTVKALQSVSNKHKMIEIEHIDCSVQISERNKRRRSQMLVVESEASFNPHKKRAKSERRSCVASEDMEDLISQLKNKTRTAYRKHEERTAKFKLDTKIVLEKKVENAAKMRKEAFEAVEHKLDNAKTFMNEKAGEVQGAVGAKYGHAKMLMVDKTAEAVEAVAKIKKENDTKAAALVEMAKTKMKAYVGRVDEAEDFVVDNEYIQSGYRINHDTNGRVFKSLFTCHNETVNVWSHCLGVFMFLLFLFGLLIWIVPSQLDFASELIERRTNYSALLATEIEVLNTLTDEVVLLTPQDDDQTFQHSVDRIMKNSEGVFLYVMTYLFPFDYLEDDVIQNSLNVNQTVTLWQDNILDYCSKVEELLQKVNLKLESDTRAKTWTRERLYFLNQRILQYTTQIKALAERLRQESEGSSSDDIVESLSSAQEKLTKKFKTPTEILNKTSFIPLTAHIFAACFCMGCSALYHLFWVKNEKTASSLSRLDYGGISILIFGSTVPVTSYGMTCEPVQIQRIIVMVAMGVCCLICFIVTICPGFDAPKYRKWRGIMFMTLGLMTAALFSVFWIWPEECVHTNAWLWALGGYIYIQGAVIYVIRVPERCAPGKFDLCCQSHQIFHFAVVGACTLQFYLNYSVYLDRQNFLGCPIWRS